jgi:prepilin-type N-terminal cleavage/methylation domain-containing protein
MNKKGVTLIELIIVMVIIAIGAALMAPNIGKWLPNYRLRSASRDLVSTMRTAQMKAISVNLPYQVLLTPPSSYVLRYQNTAGLLVNEGTTQILPPGVTISANTFAGNIAQFNTNSTASAGSVTLVTLTGSGNSGKKIITVTPSTGRCKID